MSAIVQIWFEHSWSDEELYQGAQDWGANVKPTIPGLQWKIFTKDPSQKQSCGIYLFDTLESANAYVQGERVQQMKDSPDLRNISVRVSQVLEQASILAGAPLVRSG